MTVPSSLIVQYFANFLFDWLFEEIGLSINIHSSRFTEYLYTYNTDKCCLVLLNPLSPDTIKISPAEFNFMLLLLKPNLKPKSPQSFNVCPFWV